MTHSPPDSLVLLPGLANSQSSFDERLEALFMVKNTVGELPTQSDLTREILRLINREVDLLNRLRPVKSLQGLRRRILHLFVEVGGGKQCGPAMHVRAHRSRAESVAGLGEPLVVYRFQ